MYEALRKELETFEQRTPKSAEAHKKNLKRIPLGVASNYRAYDPYPIFVKEAQGSHGDDQGKSGTFSRGKVSAPRLTRTAACRTCSRGRSTAPINPTAAAPDSHTPGIARLFVA